MYAKLGNIEFNALIGFDSLSDKRETLYAEHALVNGKPILQKVGESLIEFSTSINFHVAFCNPEEQYKKLNDARINGEVLPFIYGNGFIEGDFVLTSLERTINQTDAIGNFVSITCNITLREYFNNNTAIIQQERDKKNAFAISSNRPLPSNPVTANSNPSLAVMNENKAVTNSTNKINTETNTLNNSVNNANSAPPITKAQAFVDKKTVFIQNTNEQLTIAGSALTLMNGLLVAHAKLGIASPTLSTVIVNSQNAITALQNHLIIVTALPSSIPDVPTALNALTQLTTLLNLVASFVTTTKEVNKANASIAIALTLKKDTA